MMCKRNVLIGVLPAAMLPADSTVVGADTILNWGASL